MRSTAEIFGDNVRRIREEQRLTKMRFCDMIGIGRPLLDSIERGRSNVRLSYLVKIAEALETTPYDLLREAPPEVPARRAHL